jgi:hypothetical protein
VLYWGGQCGCFWEPRGLVAQPKVASACWPSQTRTSCPPSSAPPPRITHILALQPSCYLQSDSYTALHHAAQLGYSDVVAALLTCGADPNKALKLADGMEFDKFTALHIAASLDHVQVVEALVEHGANVNQTAVRALV